VAGEHADWDIDPDHQGVGHITDRFHRAAMLCRRDPLRLGNVVHLPDVGDAIVLGDLHGDLDNLQHVVTWAALHKHSDRYLILQELIHGGPDDGQGGDASFRLLEYAAALKCQFKSQVQVILSNHDLAEMTGGVLTKAGKLVSELFRRGLANAYGAAWPEVHQAYRQLLASFPLAARTASGVFISHSTPGRDALRSFDYAILDRPLTLDDCQRGSSLYEFVWGRAHDERAANRFANAVGAQILVTGHQNSMPGVKAPTSRHIILTSDGPMGRFLQLPLATSVPHRALVRQVTKIRSLAPTKDKTRRQW